MESITFYQTVNQDVARNVVEVTVGVVLRQNTASVAIVSTTGRQVMLG